MRWLLALCLLWGLGSGSAAWAVNAWEPSGPWGGDVQSLAVHSDGQTVWAGTNDGGVFKSTDGGAHWSATNTGLANLDVRSLALHSDGQTVWAGTYGGGVFKSTDGGANWSAAHTGLGNPDVQSLALHSDGQTVWAGTWDGVFKSIDGGANWSATNTGLGNLTVLSLALHSDGQTVWAGTWGGVFKSTNGGTSWSAAHTGLGSLTVRSLALHSDGQTVWAGTNGDGVFKSTNGGANWSAVNTGLGNLNVPSLALHSDGQMVWAGIYGSGVFKSTDGGAHWSATNTGLANLNVRSLALHSDGQAVWAGTYGSGVFKSTDGGAHWSAAQTGLGNLTVQSLAVHSDGQTVFAGTANRSAFKSTNGALSSESRLQGLVLDAGSGPVALSPVFDSGTLNYTATVQGASATLAPTAWIGDATLTVQGAATASGSASGPIALAVGSNALGVVVTSGDGMSTRTYTVTVTRQVVAPGAPTGVVATPSGSGKLTVGWAAPAASGSSPLAGYTVAGSPGGACSVGAGVLSCEVQGLSNGTAYTFVVTAANGEGASTPSAPSSPATPQGTPQTIGFANPGAQNFGAAPVLSVSATSGLPVAVVSTTPAVCTVSGTTVTLVTVGTCHLTATQPGDATWAAAVPVPQSFAVNAVAPGVPTGVQATPSGGGQATVSWVPPANTGGGITQYTVTALANGQPSGQTCTATPPATSCTVTGLQAGTTYTFAVAASNGAGHVPASAPSNPVTPLANPKAFSAPSPTGTGTVAVAVASGGGATCAFESVQLLQASGASTAPPAGLHLPHGLLDFVLSGCNATDVALTISYPSPLPQGVQYWKLSGGTWAPYGGAAAVAGATTATLTLRDGGAGDDDGAANGRIVDPGQVGVMAGPGPGPGPGPGGAVGIPTLSQWGLVLLAAMLGLLGWRRQQRG